MYWITTPARKLQTWFEDQWLDPACIDISKELVEIIDTSWAREERLTPYHIYLNMAYHLSQEARAGLSEFKVPKDFGNQLLPFQTAAVTIAAHYLNKRGGVVIGDVVGLGRTFMAVALARIFQDDHGTETLSFVPKTWPACGKTTCTSRYERPVADRPALATHPGGPLTCFNMGSLVQGIQEVRHHVV